MYLNCQVITNQRLTISRFIRRGLSIPLIVAALVGCTRNPEGPVVARVGKSVLTLDDLYSSIPPQYRGQISREQHIAYVKQWIDSELLYQEALRRRIHRDKTIRKRLERMKRDLLCAEVMSRGSNVAGSIEIPEEAVIEYYEQNQEDFRRHSDAVKYLEMMLGDYETARKVRSMANAGNFQDLAAKFSSFPVAEPENSPFVPVDQFPSEISKALLETRISATSQPVKTEEGYSIFYIIDRKKNGTICTVDEVRQDILSQLTSQAQKAEIDRMMVELRRSMDVEYDLGVIPEKYDNSGSVPENKTVAR